MAQDVAILDFGSSKITVLIGERGVNNTITINGIGESEYDGFCDAEWLSPDQLAYAVGHAVSKAETNSRTKIRHIYVGVPGEFNACVCRDIQLSLSKKRKITEADVDELHEQGCDYDEWAVSGYTLINSQPIYYTLDDERRLIQPVGLNSTKLGGHMSYELASNKFISTVERVLNEVGIESYDFVSGLLAETLFLFDDIKRDQYVLLLDVGYITTSIVLARGDGILFHRSFSYGGGHITGELAKEFGISFSLAENLKRKVILSLNAGDQDVYTITTREGSRAFSAKQANGIVADCIAYMGTCIEKCLSYCEYDFPDYIPYNLTGGGLSYLKGARDCLSKNLNKSVEIIAPALPQLARPHLSSSLGLMNMVLNQQTPIKKKGLFQRLFGKQ